MSLRTKIEIRFYPGDNILTCQVCGHAPWKTSHPTMTRLYRFRDVVPGRYAAAGGIVCSEACHEKSKVTK